MLQSLTFTRTESDRIYYTHLKTSLRYSVKYDLFNDKEQIATLLTNNQKTFTLTKDNIRLSMSRKVTWSFRNDFLYLIYDESEQLLSTIYVHRPVLLGFFKNSVYNITFEKSGATYNLVKRKRKDWKYADADFCYDIIFENEIKCSIINFFKPRAFHNPTTVKFEGIIEFDESINLKSILCFVQFVNVHIDLEFDI